MNRQSLGQKGEEVAQEYLLKKGYKIMERNFRLPHGELDIVAKKSGRIVFVEVKTIKQQDGYSGQDHVNNAKKRQLIKMAELYFIRKGLNLGRAFQIDIVEVQLNDNGSLAVVNHFANAIEDK